jgi:hypothetical protein
MEAWHVAAIDQMPPAVEIQFVAAALRPVR